MNENEIKKELKYYSEHELDLDCAWCGSPTLSQLAEPEFHGHKPYIGLVEVLECLDCCKYTLVLWKLASKIKLKEVQ